MDAWMHVYVHKFVDHASMHASIHLSHPIPFIPFYPIPCYPYYPSHSIHPEVFTYRNTLNANILIVSYRLFYLHFNYKNNRFLISDTYGNFRMPLQHVWYHKRRSQLPSRDRAVHVQAEYSSSYVF